MNYRQTMTERAYRDIDEAAAWYENEGETLGGKLKEDVIDTIRNIAAHPHFYPVVDPPFRGARCKTFPYKIYYAVLEEEIVILAIYHLKRDLKRWNDPNR